MDLEQQVEKLVRSAGTRDPERLAAELHVHLYPRPFEDLCGMYALVKQRRCIFYRQNLQPEQRRLIIAHELGHDQLHRDLLRVMPCLQDQSLYDFSSKPELEANSFAAYLLIPESELMTLLRESVSDESMASLFGVDLNLLLLRLRLLQKKHHLAFNLRYLPHADFLKSAF